MKIHNQFENKMKDVFSKIYKNNIWQHGSGEGSLPFHTLTYIKFLETFIQVNEIKSIVDFGCGDWQFSRNINWNQANYIGFDIVNSVICANRISFSTPSIHFYEFNGDLDTLPTADLLIVKDVLQHWSNESISNFLPVLSKYKFALITNCVSPIEKTINRNISDGDFRPLDLLNPPFMLDAKIVFTFTNRQSLISKLLSNPRWKKDVLLVNTRSIIK